RRVLQHERRVAGVVRVLLRRPHRPKLDPAERDPAADLERALVKEPERGADGEGLARAGLADDGQAAAGVHRVAEVADQVGPAGPAPDLDVEVLHADDLVRGGGARGHERVPCLRWMAAALT